MRLIEPFSWYYGVVEINSAGGEAIFVKADVTKETHAANMVKATVKEFGKLNILFNNVGRGSGGTVVNTTEEYWDEIMAINLKPTLFGSKYSIPEMIKSEGGSIINMASIGGLSGRFSATFCASKGGMVLLTKEMAVDYARDNIRVNCVCPGFTETEMLKTYLEKQDDPDEARKIFSEMAALRRIGQPEEIACSALFFASDESSFITGVALPVDGGYVANGMRKIQ